MRRFGFCFLWTILEINSHDYSDAMLPWVYYSLCYLLSVRNIYKLVLVKFSRSFIFRFDIKLIEEKQTNFPVASYMYSYTILKLLIVMWKVLNNCRNLNLKFIGNSEETKKKYLWVIYVSFRTMAYIFILVLKKKINIFCI